MLTTFIQDRADIFDSRRTLDQAQFDGDEVTALFHQRPQDDRWFDLDLAKLRDYARTPVMEVFGANNTQIYKQFPETRGWREQEVRSLIMDPGPRGHRFRETIATAAAGDVRAAVRRVVLDASKALPTPHELFDQLLLQGAIRIPPDDLMPLAQLQECKDPAVLVRVAKKIWSYSGLDGIAGDHGYADLENPPDATLMKYHGDPSRAGFNLTSRIAWSAEFETALLTRTPIAMSNMEANSDLISSERAAAAGVMPALFSSPKEERIKAAKSFGRNILITVRTSADEIALAKELLTLGANVHVELANAFSHVGLGAVIELKRFIREQQFESPRFVTLGKSVTGAFFIACILAGADGVFVNRGSSMICSTPTVTGSGIRTWSAVYETALAQRLGFILTGLDVPYWADAGVNSGADILKAMHAGAEGTMVGTTFIRTMDSPPRKFRVEIAPGEFEHRTESWGDASAKGQRRKLRENGVAPQGVSTTHSIPLNPDGTPAAITDVAARLKQEIQAGGADAFVQSASHIPLLRDNGAVRFPEEGASLELRAKEKPPKGNVEEIARARVGDD